ncbi:radical SAM protein [Candidatus Roizmanbacteria bacterium]|nr:radical SAM protein [Candidatus Roizmanbacteria bacterium]
MKYFIKTFGCQQNHSDSERIESTLKARRMTKARSYKTADYIVINTCMIRESAENRVYGLVNNLGKLKKERSFKIIVTGCMVGLAFRDKTGKYLKKIRETMPEVDEFLPIEEIGFDNAPVRQDRISAWVPISNGCNNFCTFCIVPFTRGREISRPYQDIIDECRQLKKKGYKNITLLGQNVNSYGADLLVGENNIQVMRDLPKKYFGKKQTGVEGLGIPTARRLDDLLVGRALAGKDPIQAPFAEIKPVYVKHLGRYRIPTLFPHLLEEVAKMNFEKVDFISSNPWDFSDELISVIAKNKNITRLIHLPIQSGDDNVLKRMNRWYTQKQYLNLITKLKKKIPAIKFSTDIIVGFCGETEKEFRNTVSLAKKVGFEKAYLAMYSSRFGTAATKNFKDDIPHTIKEKRWLTLEKLINRPRLSLSRN